MCILLILQPLKHSQSLDGLLHFLTDLKETLWCPQIHPDHGGESKVPVPSTLTILQNKNSFLCTYMPSNLSGPWTRQGRELGILNGRKKAGFPESSQNPLLLLVNSSKYSNPCFDLKFLEARFLSHCFLSNLVYLSRPTYNVQNSFQHFVFSLLVYPSKLPSVLFFWFISLDCY